MRFVYFLLVSNDLIRVFLLAGSSKSSPNDPVKYLDRLSSIFRHLLLEDRRASHPCRALIVDETWPVLARACRAFCGDMRVTERCCRALRFAVRCLGTQSAPILSPMAEQMVSSLC
jgi:transportin-3